MAFTFQEQDEQASQISEGDVANNLVRIRHPNQCFARIQLKVQFNKKSGCHDGETQMLYYPRHSHSTGVAHSHLANKKKLQYRGLTGATKIRQASGNKHSSSNGGQRKSNVVVVTKPPPPPYAAPTSYKNAATSMPSMTQGTPQGSQATQQLITRKAGPFNAFSVGGGSGRPISSDSVVMTVQQPQQQFVAADSRQRGRGQQRILVSGGESSRMMMVDGKESEMMVMDRGEEMREEQKVMMSNGAQQRVSLPNTQRIIMSNGEQVLYTSAPMDENLLINSDGEQRILMSNGDQRFVVNDGTDQRIIFNDGEQRLVMNNGDQRAVIQDNGQRLMMSNNSTPDQRILMSDGEEQVMTSNGRVISGKVVIDENGRMIMQSEEGDMVVEPGSGMMLDNHNRIMLGGRESLVIEQPDDGCDEFVLPADRVEWEKLFDHLLLRLRGEVEGSPKYTPEERLQAESLLQYRHSIAEADVEEQVRIFQSVCTLTNALV